MFCCGFYPTAVIACDEVLQQEKFLPESTGSVNQVIVVTTDTIGKVLLETAFENILQRLLRPVQFLSLSSL